MARVVITLNIMPESPDVDLGEVLSAAKKDLEKFKAVFMRVEEEPVAFGLKALKLTFSVDEKGGDTEPLEEKIKTIEGVQSVEVISASRGLG